MLIIEYPYFTQDNFFIEEQMLFDLGSEHADISLLCINENQYNDKCQYYLEYYQNQLGSEAIQLNKREITPESYIQEVIQWKTIN